MHAEHSSTTLCTQDNTARTEVAQWQLTRCCYGNCSDNQHRCPATDRSVVFARWCPNVLYLNTLSVKLAPSRPLSVSASSWRQLSSETISRRQESCLPFQLYQCVCDAISLAVCPFIQQAGILWTDRIQSFSTCSTLRYKEVRYPLRNFFRTLDLSVSSTTAVSS